MNWWQTDLSVRRRALQGGRGQEIVKTLADCLIAIGNAKRLEIVRYCLGPRKFTDIIVNLKLNPASFKFHSQVLMDCGLIEKVERGVYRTTELGKKLLELVKKATAISRQRAL
jgi:predicted transcriptional regulator